MRKKSKSPINAEQFLEALEEMIDSKNDAYNEERFGRISNMNRILETRYYPSKQVVKRLILYLQTAVDF
jgi:hypothetical protein